MLPLILYAKTYIINDQWVTVVKIVWKNEGRGSVVTRWLILYFRMPWVTHHFCDTPVLTLDSKSDYSSYRYHILITASTSYTHFQKNKKERNPALLSSFKRITKNLSEELQKASLYIVLERFSAVTIPKASMSSEWLHSNWFAIIRFYTWNRTEA